MHIGYWVVIAHVNLPLTHEIYVPVIVLGRDKPIQDDAHI